MTGTIVKKSKTPAAPRGTTRPPTRTAPKRSVVRCTAANASNINDTLNTKSHANHQIGREVSDFEREFSWVCDAR